MKNKTDSWLLLWNNGLQTSQATKSWCERMEEEMRGRLVCVYVWRAGEWPAVWVCVCGGVCLCVCVWCAVCAWGQDTWNAKLKDDVSLLQPVPKSSKKETVDMTQIFFKRHDTDVFSRDILKTHGTIGVSLKCKWQRAAQSWGVNYSRTYVCSKICTCDVKCLRYLKRAPNTIILILQYLV